MVGLTDTHCHIHEAQYITPGNDEVQEKWRNGGKPSQDDIIANARKADVIRLICVGTTAADSELAVKFAAAHRGVWAAVGIHPHEAEKHLSDLTLLTRLSVLTAVPKVVAIGECGLDYFHEYSSKQAQQKVLRFQIELALRNNLPLVFHVRDAFDDFWPILDGYDGVRGVIHSFTANTKELNRILSRNLYVGLNGIMTFTKRNEQLIAAKAIPLANLLLETDAPFLTPAPQRGTICEPKHVRTTAEFLSRLRGESLVALATATSRNAQNLFSISGEVI